MLVLVEWTTGRSQPGCGLQPWILRAVFVYTLLELTKQLYKAGGFAEDPRLLFACIPRLLYVADELFGEL
jgi:hypothetical protein